MRPSQMILTVAAALGVAAFSCAETPALFSDIPLAEALERAEEPGTILVIDFTADWCLPCKRMDRETWVDENVVAWFREHGLAIQIDVDERTDVARDYQVGAMPTLIAIKEGEIADRAIGYKSPEELLAWLGGVQRGETELERLRGLTLDEEGAKNTDVEARYELARRLLRAGRYDEATEEFVWLWEHMLEIEPAMYGVRLSFMLRDIERLISAHPPARAAFTEIRDDVSERIDAGRATDNELRDWAALNRALGESGETLAWYERAKKQGADARAISAIAMELEDVLVEAERWAELGRLHDRPEHEVEQRLSIEYPSMPEMDDQQRRMIEESQARGDISYASRMYGACLAAGREGAAGRIARMLLDKHDTPAARLALVEWAVRVGRASPDHRAWLDEAEEAGAATRQARAALEKALADHAR